MTAVIVVLVLVIALAIGYMAWASSQSDVGVGLSEPPPTEAELFQARLDLQRIERDVDVVLAKHEARLEAERTKRAIADALGNQ